MSKLINGLFANATNDKNNLSAKEINRRLEITQDNEKNLKRYKKVYEDNVLKNMQVSFNYYLKKRKITRQVISILLIMLIIITKNC